MGNKVDPAKQSDDISELLLAVQSWCTYDLHFYLPDASMQNFVLLQDALIAEAANETLIAFARDNACRIDVGRIEAKCWKTWETMLSVENDEHRLSRVLFQQTKLAVLVPGVDILRLEDFVVLHSNELWHGNSFVCHFADEVRGANVQRLENVLFADSSKRNWGVDLAEFASVKGADVLRIQEAIIEFGDLSALCKLLTGSYNMGYRKPSGVNEKRVLDAIRNRFNSGDFKEMHPLDLICCYERAKGIAIRIGADPIVDMSTVRRSLMSPTERAEEHKEMVAMARAKMMPGTTTVQ